MIIVFSCILNSMEIKIFDKKAMSLSEMVPQTQRPGPTSFPLGLKSKGVCPRASYSRISNASYKSKQSVSSDGNGNGNESVGADSYFHQINGTKNRSIADIWSTRVRVLEAVDDAYGGVVVDPEKLPSDPNYFAHLLRSSLSHWKMKGKQGVWLKLPVEQSELVPVAVKEGFEYHHAERGYIMLTHWIPEGPSMLPSNASHQVGVGGFVINGKNEVLVVQEKHCDPAVAGLWKIPTGFILASEEIFTGAVREVKEETGIDTEFIEVIAFRHVHNMAFEKSDLFFICMLRPISSEILVDDLEIQAAKWMPLVDFVEQPLIQEDRMFKKVTDICIAQLGQRYCGLHSHQLVSKFDGKPSTLYYNVMESQDINCLGV